MPNQKLQDHIAEWEVLQASARVELADVPHSAADVAELTRMILAGKDLEVRRAALRESLAKASKDRLDLIQSGNETYQRLALSLRAKLGPQSEALLRFGVSPRKSRRRKGTNAAPIEGEPPAAPAQPEPSSPPRA